MDERAERIGRNEAIFREANERLEGINVAFADFTETMTLVCECGDIACTEQMVMSLPEYEALRADSRQFAVKPDHLASDVEHLVRKKDTYWIVRKRPGDPAELADALDRRSS